MTAKADRYLPPPPLPAYFHGADRMTCEGWIVTGPDPVVELCRVLLKAGFHPKMGLVIRRSQGGPIERVVPSIAAEIAPPEADGKDQ